VQKLVLMSVLLATFIIPAVARATGPAQDAFPRVLRGFLAFVGVYVLLLIYVYPRLS
jgi:hypothetical protein